VQQIERDCFSVAKRRSIYIYTKLAFLALLGAPYIYEISSLRAKYMVKEQRDVVTWQLDMYFLILLKK